MATATKTVTKNIKNVETQLGPPKTIADWARYILIAIGVTPTTHGNAVKNLIAQINLEVGGTKVTANNPLNTSNTSKGSYSRQGTYIPGYHTWVTGIKFAAIDIEANPSILKALNTNVKITDYGAALAQGTWEGYTPTANATYGQGVITRFNSILKGQNGGKNQFDALGTGVHVTPNKTQQTAGGVTTDTPFAFTTSIKGFFGDLIGGFGIGWKAVGTVLIGIAFIVIGIILIFRKGATQIVESVVP